MRRREGCHSEERDTNTNCARTKNDRGAFQLAVNDPFVCGASPRTAAQGCECCRWKRQRRWRGDDRLEPIEFVRFAFRSSRGAFATALMDHGGINTELAPHHEHLMLENIRQSSSTAEIGRWNDGIDNHRPAGSILKLKELAKCRPGLEVSHLRRIDW
jgi:hypothetical protein